MSVLIRIYRMPEIGDTTLGILQIEGVTHPPIYTLEDSWKNNQRQVSCIPKGEYLCKPHGWSKLSLVKFKRVWEITKVKGRPAVLFHQGNTAADTLGCILVGFEMGTINGKVAILRSVPALDFLRGLIGEKEFRLEIVSVKEMLGMKDNLGKIE